MHGLNVTQLRSNGTASPPWCNSEGQNRARRCLRLKDGAWWRYSVKPQMFRMPIAHLRQFIILQRLDSFIVSYAFINFILRKVQRRC